MLAAALVAASETARISEMASVRAWRAAASSPTAAVTALTSREWHAVC